AANEIACVPDEIASLTNLEQLNLGANRLTVLPDSLGDLKNLTLLDIRDNQIATLPTTLAPLLDSGQLVIRADGNNLDQSVQTLIARGGREIAAYLRSLEDGQPQYEAKVLLVGEGNVGKTSLVAALRGEGFENNRPTTHGIRVRDLTLPYEPLQHDL